MMAVSALAPRVMGSPALSPAVITVPKDATFYTDITTENTSGAAVTKDFLAAFGRYKEAEGAFELHWGHVRTGVSISTGTATNTVTCSAVKLGTDWDCLGAMGTYNAATKVFTIESALVLKAAVTVSGVAVTKVAVKK